MSDAWTAWTFLAFESTSSIPRVESQCHRLLQVAAIHIQRISSVSRGTEHSVQCWIMRLSITKLSSKCVNFFSASTRDTWWLQLRFFDCMPHMALSICGMLGQ